jgi:hypothetical protein
MGDASDRLCHRVLTLCRDTPEIAEGDMVTALTEALSSIIIRSASNEAEARQRIKSVARLMRSDVRLAQW